MMMTTMLTLTPATDIETNTHFDDHNDDDEDTIIIIIIKKKKTWT